jgi:hypothetical protein
MRSAHYASIFTHYALNAANLIMTELGGRPVTAGFCLRQHGT